MFFHKMTTPRNRYTLCKIPLDLPLKNLMVEKSKALTLRLELIWWIVTALLLAGILFPIYKSKAEYPFWLSNTIFILVFVTLTRYLFFLKHTFLGYIQWLKVVVFFLCIPLVIYLLKAIYAFNDYVDRVGLEGLFEHFSWEGQSGMVDYVRTEMILFGVGSIVASVLMPFRMLISFWRMHNRGTV